MVVYENNKASSTQGPPLDPHWAHTASGYYHRLIKIRTAVLKGQSGVYIVWHAGGYPEWVFAGHADDLAAAFGAVAANEAVMQYEKSGGLYASWSPIRKEYQAGVVRYLLDTLKPLVENPNAPAKTETPIPIIPPGARGAAI